jgi:hypothetical protein
VREVQLSLEEAPSGALVDPRPLGALTSLDELWVNEAWLLPGPVLERLSALFCAVRPQHLEAFTTLNFDRLTALSLELAAETEPQHLEAFLTGRTVPRLELLELQVDGRHDEWLALVGQSAVLPRLQVLRLGSREPRPDEVTPAFAHLREFQLP